MKMTLINHMLKRKTTNKIKIRIKIKMKIRARLMMMKIIKINLKLKLKVSKMHNFRLLMHNQIAKNMIYIRKGEEGI
jgi:hypothetical protein